MRGVKLSEELKQVLLDAEAAKALATVGPCGLNVAAVSSIKLVDDTIWLVDYFMNKTRKNIQATQQASLVAWSGLASYQVRAAVTYHTKGAVYVRACKWVQQIHPERAVQGVLVLTPEEVFDASITDKV